MMRAAVGYDPIVLENRLWSQELGQASPARVYAF
jgi:hypothetical protein